MIEAGIAREKDGTFSAVYCGQVIAHGFGITLAEAQRAIGEKLLENLAYRGEVVEQLAVDVEYIRVHSDLNPDAMSRDQIYRLARTLRSEQDSERVLQVYEEVRSELELAAELALRDAKEWVADKGWKRKK